MMHRGHAQGHMICALSIGPFVGCEHCGSLLKEYYVVIAAFMNVMIHFWYDVTSF